ncbi:hypothetical protein V9L05_19910 [Bernardetia sp. Wsw4-3y2]|uniref:hypothetical protein n=1 Tax=Bernardetia sp. Wsw4-3y2 TaxID=3127471 RepID=UPI0030D503D8
MNTLNYLKVGLLLALLSFSYVSNAQISLNDGLKLGKKFAKDAKANKKSKLAEQYTIKETTSEGLELIMMRVPIDKIKSDAKNSIIEAQNGLQTAYTRYKSKMSIENVDRIRQDISRIRAIDRDWLVASYESESEFYQSYEKKRVKEEREAEKKRKLDELENQRKRVDSLKKASEEKEYQNRVRGYHFVNKEDLQILETAQNNSKQLGKVSLCSYIKVLDTTKVNGYVEIKVDDITGYVLSEYLVNDLDKITVPYADIQSAKKSMFTSVSKTVSEEEAKELRRLAKEQERQQNNINTGRKYYRGPRGGCYYIDSGGNKQYVDRNICN